MNDQKTPALVSKARIVYSVDYISTIISRYKLNCVPSHPIWEAGYYEEEAKILVDPNQEKDFFIGRGKLNFHYNNSWYPTVGLWVNKAGNFGILWFASSYAKKLYKKQRREYQEAMKSLEKKISGGNFTLEVSFREKSATMKSSYSDKWTKQYAVGDGQVTVVYHSGREGRESFEVEPGERGSNSWDPEPEGTPLEKVDFYCHYDNISSSGCGNGPWHYSGNGVKWIKLIRELYPEIKIPE